MLIIDGVEKAERNVLPILNNLLENREIQLDDGRFLMAHKKYDELLTKYTPEQLKNWGFERVSENFSVIALGIPVPTFKGFGLDPPFRSRFQCKIVPYLNYDTILKLSTELAPNVPRSRLENFLSVVYGLNSQHTEFQIGSIHSSSVTEKVGQMPIFPIDSIFKIVKIWVRICKLCIISFIIVFLGMQSILL